MPSTFGYVYYANCTRKYHNNFSYGFKQSFEKEDDAMKSFQQLKMFMKECIIPLAIRTKALIITEGINKCSLATTFGSMAQDIFKQRTGDDLQF